MLVGFGQFGASLSSPTTTGVSAPSSTAITSPLRTPIRLIGTDAGTSSSVPMTYPERAVTSVTSPPPLRLSLPKIPMPVTQPGGGTLPMPRLVGPVLETPPPSPQDLPPGEWGYWDQPPVEGGGETTPGETAAASSGNIATMFLVGAFALAGLGIYWAVKG